MQRGIRPGMRALDGGRPRAAPDGERSRMLRYGRAWRQALHTAQRLVRDFGAARVVAIGTLVHPDRFHDASRIELVVFGLRADVLQRARSLAADATLPARILDGDRAAGDVLAQIQAEGVELARQNGLV